VVAQCSTDVFDPLSPIRHCEAISAVHFSLCFVAKQYDLQQVSEEANRKLHARNTTVQLLTLYTDRECHNAQRYRWTDRHMDRWHYDANSWSHCVTVRQLKSINSEGNQKRNAPVFLIWPTLSCRSTVLASSDSRVGKLVWPYLSLQLRRLLLQQCQHI